MSSRIVGASDAPAVAVAAVPAGLVVLDGHAVGVADVVRLADGTARPVPGSEAMPIADLRLASRALRAASRAAAASMILPMMVRAWAGFSSSHSANLSAIRLSSGCRTSDETSLSLVWLENLGSGSLTDTIAVKPSRMSSPVSVTFSFFRSPDF